MSPYYDYYDTANTSFDNNQAALRETRDIQRSTLEALERTRRRAGEARDVGQQTLQRLEEQNQQLDSAQTKTNALNDELRKAEKLQNKFSALSLQLGNRRQAKKEIAREEGPRPKEAPKTFKRRGRRPKNKKIAPVVIPEDDSSFLMNDAVEKTVQASKDVNAQVDRNELFSGAKTPPPDTAAAKKSTFKRRGPRPKKNSKTPPPPVVPLTEDDQDELNRIHDADKLVDEGIEALGREVNDLLALSKAMGDEAQRQTGKLDSIYDGLEKTDEKTKIVNKRAKLFTRTRRERKQREKQFKKNVSEITGVNGASVASAKIAAGR